MNYSKVHVQHRDGSKPHGTKVVLGFSGGMSKPAYTDRYGTAIVEHESVGQVDIYVGGKKCGSFQAPGETVAFV
jgi:hypothetical protein